ncbi:MAG: ASCH domain-containing protein [Erysipelotrichaceae bacterium]|nr:ASCH domain-containing protein [Erysipelotrichaceae bacterium]MDD3924105.1 ASCH domain-containing protein [Erysipelotrichaceae bacterium]MDD4642972.1 ASCH domain-containing protein [Erysipelotrichaceae bacterium]
MPDNTQYYEAFCFDLNEKDANELLSLVLDHKKTATSSSLYYFEKTNNVLPKPNDYSIVTDWNKNPKCVIQTIKVTILSFNEMTYELCKLEGEDEDLTSWQNKHRNFFTQEGKIIGYEFIENMSIVFEEFRIVYK